MEKQQISMLAKIVDILKAFFKAGLGVLIFIGFQLLVLLVMELLGINTKQYQGLYTALYSILAGLSLYGLSRVESDKKNKLFKISRPNPKIIPLMVVIAFGLLGLVTMYMYTARTLANIIGGIGKELEKYADSVDRFSDTEQAIVPIWDNILYMVAITFLVPVCEEFLFRGVVFGEFARVIRGWVSVILSAAVFGLLHGISVQVGYAFICGIIIATVYYLSGNMIYTICLHGIFNFFGSTLLYLLQWERLDIAKKIQDQITSCTLLLELTGLLALIMIGAISIYAHRKGMFDDAKKSFLYVKRNGGYMV